MTPHLENIHEDYAEIYFDENKNEGCVSRRKLISWTDFEKDEIHYERRWLVYLYCGFGLNGYTQVGRKTGYRTRGEAIEGLIKEIEEYRS